MAIGSGWWLLMQQMLLYPVQKKTECKADAGYQDAKVKRVWENAIMISNKCCKKSHHGHGNISCKLIQSHSKATVFLSYQVYFHGHCTRPGKALVYAQQDIGKYNP